MRKGFYVLVALFIFVSFAIAQEPEGIEPKPEQTPVLREHRLMKMLGLTEEQAEKILDYNEELDTTVTKLKLKIEKTRLELAEMLLEENVSEKSVYKKADEINKLHSQIQKATLEHYFKIMKILDKDQQKKFSKHYIKKFLGHKQGAESLKRKIIQKKMQHHE
jgi:Spy/CpxP family protein refolding chaperone